MSAVAASRRRRNHLPRRLTMRDAFLFPVGTAEARRDVLVGGTLLVLLIVGWILNLGNRLNVVSRLSADDRPYFRGFMPWGTRSGGAASLLRPSHRT